MGHEIGPADGLSIVVVRVRARQPPTRRSPRTPIFVADHRPHCSPSDPRACTIERGAHGDTDVMEMYRWPPPRRPRPGRRALAQHSTTRNAGRPCRPPGRRRHRIGFRRSDHRRAPRRARPEGPDPRTRPVVGAGGEAASAAERRRYPRGLSAPAGSCAACAGTPGRGPVDLLLHRDGLFDVDRFRRLLVLSASGVGGGSHVFEGVQVVPEDDYFAAFPDEITAQEMAPYYEAVRDMLRPAPVPGSLLKTEVFRRAVQRAGLPAPSPAELAIAMGEDPPRPTTVDECRRPVAVDVDACRDGHAGVRGRQQDDARSHVPRGGTPPRGGDPGAVRGAAARPRRRRLRGPLARSRRRHGPHGADAPARGGRAGTLGTLRLLFAARDVHRTLPDLPASLGRGFSSGGDSVTVMLPVGGAPGRGVGARHRLHRRSRPRRDGPSLRRRGAAPGERASSSTSDPAAPVEHGSALRDGPRCEPAPRLARGRWPAHGSRPHHRPGDVRRDGGDLRQDRRRVRRPACVPQRPERPGRPHTRERASARRCSRRLRSGRRRHRSHRAGVRAPRAVRDRQLVLSRGARGAPVDDGRRLRRTARGAVRRALGAGGDPAGAGAAPDGTLGPARRPASQPSDPGGSP